MVRRSEGEKTFEQKLWVEDLGTYCPYDLRNDRHIRMRE
ncbi:unnamed protein product, partial [Discosporangium mesarthrocarpum]